MNDTSPINNTSSMCDTSSKKIAILGASSGLGNALAREFDKNQFRVLLSSRKKELLSKTATALKNADFFVADYTSPIDQEKTFHRLKEFSPDHIIYCAGGGAYGKFEEKKWISHEWTFQLNFIFPAKLIHVCLRSSSDNDSFKNLQSIIYIGSQIADNKSDAMAASYCAAKHAMRGLVTSIQGERLNETNNEGHIKKNKPHCQVRLFSAPYMNTGLLPSGAWPHQVTGLVQEPEVISKIFYDWFISDKPSYE